MVIVMNGDDALSYGSVIHTEPAIWLEMTIDWTSSLVRAKTRPESEPVFVIPLSKVCQNLCTNLFLGHSVAPPDIENLFRRTLATILNQAGSVRAVNSQKKTVHWAAKLARRAGHSFARTLPVHSLSPRESVERLANQHTARAK